MVIAPVRVVFQSRSRIQIISKQLRELVEMNEGDPFLVISLQISFIRIKHEFNRNQLARIRGPIYQNSPDFVNKGCVLILDAYGLNSCP